MPEARWRIYVYTDYFFAADPPFGAGWVAQVFPARRLGFGAAAQWRVGPTRAVTGQDQGCWRRAGQAPWAGAAERWRRLPHGRAAVRTLAGGGCRMAHSHCPPSPRAPLPAASGCGFPPAGPSASSQGPGLLHPVAWPELSPQQRTQLVQADKAVETMSQKDLQEAFNLGLRLLLTPNATTSIVFATLLNKLKIPVTPKKPLKATLTENKDMTPPPGRWTSPAAASATISRPTPPRPGSSSRPVTTAAARAASAPAASAHVPPPAGAARGGRHASPRAPAAPAAAASRSPAPALSPQTVAQRKRRLREREERLQQASPRHIPASRARKGTTTSRSRQSPAKRKKAAKQKRQK